MGVAANLLFSRAENDTEVVERSAIDELIKTNAHRSGNEQAQDGMQNAWMLFWEK